ncbi:MAG TPA: winged helix-turn-helix domain-containing protein [Vicinamibacterales bacterium]|jgi:DNA-binding winged helix-turn-helix (wHTH) protein|nr:winged helix-turn-helix domain-containing protein [Vicinamibacterales bacterium]
MLRFRDFTLDPGTGELQRDGVAIRLEPQPARVLTTLAGRAGTLVTREDLRAAVWPDGTHVEFDQSLNYCVRQVRAALNDDARRPEFIETVSRRGYRFIAPVAEVRAPGRARLALKLAAAAAGLVAAVWVAERLEGPGPHRSHHETAVGVLKAVHDFLF